MYKMNCEICNYGLKLKLVDVKKLFHHKKGAYFYQKLQKHCKRGKNGQNLSNKLSLICEFGDDHTPTHSSNAA